MALCLMILVVTSPILHFVRNFLWCWYLQIKTQRVLDKKTGSRALVALCVQPLQL